MSTTEETKLIVETTIVETVEEVTQVIESSSEVTPAQIEMNPGNSQEEVSGSTNTDNQTKSEHVEDSKETVSTDEKSPENNSSEEPSQSVDHSSVSEQVADSNKQSPPAESRQQLGAADEKVENTNGVETRDASTQDSEDTKIISDEKEIPEDPLPNSESKESTEETVADKTSTNADEHEQTPMDIDQNGDKAPDTEAQPEASDNEAPEEGVFIVEAVVAHRKRAGNIQYFLKWKGYPDTDNTWEDEDNLFCTELIEEYWKTKKQDTPVKTPVKRNKPVKRKSEEAEDTPKRKVKEAREDSGDEDNWENEVKEVETVERTKDKLMIYLLWNNGKRSVHPSDEVNKKCPQKVISFYESHLSFKASS